MISAEQFLDILEKKDLLPPKLLASLRRQIAEAKTSEAKARYTAALVAKRLVDAGHLSRLLAQRLLEQGESAGPPSRQASARPAKPEPAPRKRQDSPDLTLADEELAPLDEELAPLEDDVAPLEEVASVADDDLVPLDELIPLDGPPSAGLAIASSQDSLELAPESDEEDGFNDYPVAAGPASPPRPKAPPLPPGDQTPESYESLDFLDQLIPLPSDASSADTDVAAPLPDSRGGALAAPPEKKKDFFGRGRKIQAKGNVWDSPLLLIGGGTLLLLSIVAGVLIWAISRQSAEELLKIADDSYSAGSYTRAIQEYNRFLEKAPDDPAASKAKIRRGLAQMRQAVDSSTDWSKSLEVTRTVLGEISSETDFRGEAQPELAAMLPKLAEGLAKRAHEKSDQALIGQSEETLALIEKYIARSSRPHTRLADVETLLALTKREIARSGKLAEAIAGMKAASAADKTAQAYLVRASLLKEYPDLASNEQLREAVLAVSRAEQAGVKPGGEKQAAQTAELPAPYRAAVALARRETTAEAPGAAGRTVFAVAGGATYGLDAAGGKVLWRRATGFADNGRSPGFPPTPVSDAPGSDVLLVDAARNELVCLEGPTGKLRWRFPVTERFDAHPVIAGQRVLVATRSGRLLSIDLASGESPGHIRFPQELRTGPAVSPDGSTVFQAAEHSNLFVLSLPDSRCTQVLYLGHEPGSITVPPVVVGSLLVVARNGVGEQCTLHVMSITSKDKSNSLTPLQQLPVKGHVHTAPVVSGRRMLVVTDKAELAVFEVRGTEPDKPIGKVAEGVASGEENLVRFPLLLGEQFYLGDALLTKYDVQASRGRLQPRWTENKDSVTLQPLSAIGETVYHVRRKIGLPGVFVSATASDGKTLWQTQLAAGLVEEPLAAAGSDRLVLLSSLGAVYALPATEPARPTAMDQPLAAIPVAELQKPIDHAVYLDDGSVAMAAGKDAEEIVVTNLQDSPPRLRRLALPDPLGGPLAAFSGALVAPSKIGQVFLLDPRSGEKRAEPFQPTVQSGVEYLWQRVAANGPKELLASDGRGLYRIGLEETPKRHLAMLAGAAPSSPIRSAPAVVGTAVCAVDASNNLVAFALPELKASGSWPLGGPCTWGPWQAGKHVLLATDDHLVCADGRQVCWKVPLPFGQPAGGPIADGESFLVAAAGGTVWRAELSTGKTLGRVELGAALANGPVRIGERLLVVGRDGTLYEIEKPPVAAQP
ncbi:MAG: PQQ-binding-like beta-propeller repeat protein [Pirellulales bacterium]|nr:PQQ-binding-like beta-propeller repeat protein [Pirellulales bacterium]